MLKEKCIEASETITYDGVYNMLFIVKKAHSVNMILKIHVANFSDESGL